MCLPARWEDTRFQRIRPAKDEIFYLPLGGGIEFGEHSTDAAMYLIMEGRDNDCFIHVE